jgi:hypothetical protein
MMLTVVLSVVINVGAIFFVQLLHEYRLVIRERIERHARRLRYEGSDKLVQLPPLTAGQYHIFLSHKQADGQDAMRVIKQRLLELTPDARVFLE